MGWLLRRCGKCSCYTLSTTKCPHCGGVVHVPHPAKFSPDDKYAKQRIALRMEGLQNENRNRRENIDQA
ncbi:MAG: RNA-protein complex protein Nop10 [Candidatus Bathyarchaeota archaeon]|nr:RNA-protein complex protein Nop10 [Candidatus Bathyarchaeota archaeon]